MKTELMLKIKTLPKLRLLILIFTVWQYISILGIGILNWSNSLIWLNLGLLLAFLLLCPIFESLLLLVLSIPFYVVLPNDKFDSLSMWRILFAAVFCVWLVRDRRFNFKGITFLPWDKFLGIFMTIGFLISLIFSQFFVQSLKFQLFLVNIYIFYLVLINTLKSKQQIFELIRYVVWSLAIIITLGFTQLIGTFFTDLDTFWVYWASNFSPLYYGKEFAQVALFSNSWFSYSGGRELRMFSIMPDSQSFAYICIFGLCLGTALTHNVFKYIRKWLWSGIRFAGLALILSGTRAVWVGMFLPFFVVIFSYYKNFQKHLAKKFIWPFVIILVFFAMSPIFNQALKILKIKIFKENFITRAKSIYDFKETSNQGRLALWKKSMGFALQNPQGVGFANFLVSSGIDVKGKTYSMLANEINERYNLPQKYVSAHSLYLQILIETGLLGLVAFGIFWYKLIKTFWKFILHYRKKEDFLVYFVAQALIVVLWVLAAAAFDVTIFNDKVLMFLLIDMAIAGTIVKRYHEYEEIV